MFSNLRRPVPSTAALQVLRQLAYISSGTVCGAAALVAEERRRRTRLAKKIVDNSRRLKQHPRYAHSAANKTEFAIDTTDPAVYNSIYAASLLEQDELDHESIARPWQDDKSRPRRRRSQSCQSSGVAASPSDQRRQGVGKDDYLPSAVEERYERMRSRGAGHTISPQEEQRGAAHTNSRQQQRATKEVDDAKFDTFRPVHPIQSLGECDIFQSIQPNIGVAETRQQGGEEQDAERHVFRHSQPLADRDTYRPIQPPQRVELPQTIQPAKPVTPTIGTFYRLPIAESPSDLQENDIRITYYKPRAHKFSSRSTMPGSKPYMWSTFRPGRSEARSEGTLDNSRVADQSPDPLHAGSQCMDDPAARLQEDHPPSEEPLQQLVQEYLKKKNHHALYLLFVRHSHQLGLPQDAYPALALECLKSNDYRTLSSLCLNHSHLLDLPQESYPEICSNFASTESLDAAKALIGNTLPTLSESVLAACQKSWASLLTTQWQRTRNFTAVSDLFADMIKAAGTGRLDLVVYNAMIEVCVGARKFSHGKNYLRQMQDRDRMPPDSRTISHFTLSAAKSREWDTVESLLSLLFGSAPDRAQGDRTEMFNPVLKEYARHHEADQVFHYASTAITKYRLVPDAATKNIVLESLARHRRADLISPWLELMRSCGWQADLDADSAVGMLAAFYYSSRPSHGTLLSCVQRIQRGAPRLLSQKFETLLQRAIAYDLQNLRPGTNTKRLVASAEKRLALVENMFSDHQTVSTDFLKTEAHILLQLALGKPDEAVDLYRRSLARSGLPQSTATVNMAVHASLRAQQGDTVEAEALMGSAHDAGLSVFAGMTPVMLHRLKTSARVRNDTLRTTLLAFYSKMHEDGMPIRHHIATTAARRMVDSGNSKRAIKLLKMVYNSRWASTPESAFDLPAMTVFLQSYIVSDTQAGIEWVVNTVLERDLRIDHAFIKTLKRARTHFKLTSEMPGRDHLRKVFGKVSELLELCRARQVQQIESATTFAYQLVSCIIKESTLVRDRDDKRAGETDTMRRVPLNVGIETDAARRPKYVQD